MSSKLLIIIVAGVSLLCFSGCYTSFAALQTIPAYRTAYVIEEFDTDEPVIVYAYSAWYDYVPICTPYRQPVPYYYDPIVEYYYYQSYCDWYVTDPRVVSWNVHGWYVGWHVWDWHYQPHWGGHPESFYVSSWNDWNDTHYGYTGVYLQDDHYSKRPFTHRDAILQTSQRPISGRSQINIARNTNTADQQTSQQPGLEKSSRTGRIIRIERNDANPRENSVTGRRVTIQPASSDNKRIDQENAKPVFTSTQSRPTERVQTTTPSAISSSSRISGTISVSQSGKESTTIEASPVANANPAPVQRVETRNRNSSSVVELNSNTIIRISKPAASSQVSTSTDRSNTNQNISNKNSAGLIPQSQRTQVQSQKTVQVQSSSRAPSENARTISKPVVTTREEPTSVGISQSSQSSRPSGNSPPSSGSISRTVNSNESQVQSTRSESQSTPQPASSSRSVQSSTQTRRQRR